MTTDTMSDELLPCPWCGGKPTTKEGSTYRWLVIGCCAELEVAKMDRATPHNDPINVAAAVKEWNNRDPRLAARPHGEPPREQPARELAAARAALGAIDVCGPDADGLVWIECAMPGVASGAVSISGQSLAARAFVFWRDELLKPAQSVSTRETK